MKNTKEQIMYFVHEINDLDGNLSNRESFNTFSEAVECVLTKLNKMGIVLTDEEYELLIEKNEEDLDYIDIQLDGLSLSIRMTD